MSDDPTTDQERSERRARHADQRDHLRPIGHAMIAALVALTLGSVLNARALYKSAVTQPDGIARDAAVAVTGGLQAVTQFTQISEIRQGVASAIGMSDKDTIDTTLDLPVKAAAPAPTTPKRQVFSADNKLKLYLGGDSLMETVGMAMEQIGPRTGVIKVEPNDSHISTGLNRPDYFNWFSNLRRVLSTKDPDVITLMFGDNDTDAFMSGMPAGAPSIQEFGDPAWEMEYRRRVGGMMELALQKPGRFVIWIGEPQMENSELNAKQIKLNSIYESEAAKRPNQVAYLDLYELFTAGGAPYSATSTVGGVTTLVREPDGEHITMDGGAVVSGELLKLLLEHFDLQGALPASLSLTQ